MKKNIAMPPKIFGAPLMLAGTNLSLQVPIALLLQTFSNINPLYIVFSIIFIHFFLVLLGLKSPHISQIIVENGKTKKILIDKYDLDNATLLFKDNSFVCVFKIGEYITSGQIPAEYMEYIADFNFNLRTVSIQNINYLIISGQKRGDNTSKIIKQTNFFFSDIELLTKSSDTTPADVIKSILNPISSASVVVPSHLSEKSFIVNQRRLFKNGIILFEQGGQKLYSTVLSLSNLTDNIDLKTLLRFKQRHMVSSWMLPLTSTKALVLLEQRRRLARLNLPCFRQEDEYIEAMEQVGKGEVFCYYGANVYISAPSIQQLEIYKKEVINSALQYGLTFVEETSNLPFAFYIGLPQYASQRRFLLPLSTINNI